MLLVVLLPRGKRLVPPAVLGRRSERKERVMEK